ncbi:hypothetical protein G9A89_000083 [Geosiphon pyriformis]|nr:hypothetical protein G9A89_000083 [Geosiphon pyriformis]
MENKEIKGNRPEVHDCNECEACQRSIKINRNDCSACQFIFFEKLYKNFSSGNKVIDEIIKNPNYIPPNKFHTAGLNYYEWIPWERLSNINEIARGGFGIIYKAILIDGRINLGSIKHHGSMEYKRRGTNAFGKMIDEVAIKIIKTNSLEVLKELNFQRAIYINNGGYLRYISSIWGITQNAETLEYGIVMEFAEHGDMRKYLSNFHSTSWKNKLRIACDIAEGLNSIHSSGMVHRDLHSGNILQLSKRIISIGDLGLCQPTKNEATTTTDPTIGKAMEEKKIYGVIPYIPPEVLRGENFTTAGDIYSFAMLLWELATGKPPFYDRDHDQILIMAILDGARPKITSPLIPPSIVEIIKNCWDVNPDNRPTAEEVKRKLNGLWYTTFEFLESEKYVFEMLKNDSKTTTTKTTTTTNIKIHPGAVYTSRVLTLQMIDFSKGWIVSHKALKNQNLYKQDGNLTFPIVVDWRNQIKVPFQFNRITKRSQSAYKTLMDPKIGFLTLYKESAYLASDAYCDLGSGRINVKYNFITSRSLNAALVVYFAGPKRKKISWRDEIDRQIVFQVKNFPTYDDVHVNKPVMELIDSVFPSILENIRKYLEKKPSKTTQILFTGHAIGGAYASIVGIRWTMQRYVILKLKSWPEIDMNGIGQHIITFGAPRIGNREFSRFANMLITHHRITHGNDHVPHFPLAKLGWNHFGIEIWIEPLENCNCPDDDDDYDVNFHPYSYWDCNNQSLETKKRQYWLEEWTSENMECNGGQSIINVPDDLFHDGPYFGIRMGDCS